jgi:hypothetical protein
VALPGRLFPRNPLPYYEPFISPPPLQKNPDMNFYICLTSNCKYFMSLCSTKLNITAEEWNGVYYKVEFYE